LIIYMALELETPVLRRRTTSNNNKTRPRTLFGVEVQVRQSLLVETWL
jgi:hypothetical protein